MDLFYPLGVGRVTDGYWDDALKGWFTDVLVDDAPGKMCRGDLQPTHWMPLPEPPNAD